MTIRKLSSDAQAMFAELPEVDMGLQICTTDDNSDAEHLYSIVVACKIVITFDKQFEEDLGSLRGLLGESLGSEGERYADRLLDWTDGLEEAEKLGSVDKGESLFALRYLHLGPLRGFPKPPPRPSWIYGHLPFRGICGSEDVYYRYEQYPTSLRIDRTGTKHHVTGVDTYAAPQSELFFTPTGLSAVGRFALPSLLPACWRYELRPAAGTIIRSGASVPLYGQSGGAVEVCFERSFQNRGPIADPVVLPVL
nr:hypothetical protein [uncultured Hyphomonas sp.]